MRTIPSGPRCSSTCLLPGGGGDARHGRRRRLRRQHGQRRLGLAAHGRVAVDDGRADVAQDAGRAIAARRVLEQLGRLVDQRRVRLAGDERRVRQHVLEEREVGLDAADAELAQRAHRLAPHVVPLEAAGRDLDQQRVVVLRHARADVARAVVQADAVADRRPVDLDLAGVGQEVVARVLGGDAHLDGDAALLDVGLAADADLRIGQAVALRDAQLRLHQVAPRDRLGHRVLDLDARVDLDEVVAAVLGRPGTRPCRRSCSGRGARSSARRRPGARAAPRAATTRARIRPPSGGGAAPSSRARTGGRCCRGCRPGSAPRCAWGARPASRGISCRRRTPCAPRSARARAARAARTRCARRACRARRRRPPP